MLRISFILIFLFFIISLSAVKGQQLSKNSTSRKIQGREFDKEKHCKCRTIRSRVINGSSPFGEDDFPFLALIYITDFNSRILRSVCTGTILNSFIILTTASCVNTLHRLMYNGWFPRAAAGKDHHAQTIIGHMDLDRIITGSLKHPNYNPAAKDPLKDNIALVQLEMPFEFGEKTGILPACLYEYKRAGDQEDFRFEKDDANYRVMLDGVGYGGNEYQYAINPQSSLFRSERDYLRSLLPDNYVKFRSPKTIKSKTIYPSASDKFSLVLGSSRPWSIRLFQYQGKYCRKTADRICTRMSTHANVPPYDDYGSMCSGDGGSPLLYFDRQYYKFKVIGILASTNLADLTYNDTIKPLCKPDKVVNNYLYIGRYFGWIFQTIAKMIPSIAGEICY